MPSSPSSSPMTARMKSVWASGRKKAFWVDCPMPLPEQAARAQGDLPLDGLEARAARVGPRVQERAQPRAPVGLDDGEEHDQEGADPEHVEQVADRHPGGDEQRRRGEGDDQRGPEVGLEGHEQARAAEDEQQRRDHAPEASGCAWGGGPGTARRRGRARSSSARRAGTAAGRAEPAPGAVDLHAEAGDEHEQHERERAGQGQRRERARATPARAWRGSASRPGRWRRRPRSGRGSRCRRPRSAARCAPTRPSRP